MSKQSEFEKVVESLIDDVAIGMYCDENHSLSDELERNEHEISEAKDVMQRLVPQLAAHILKVADDCSFDAYTNEGIKMRVVMLEDLENYIKAKGGA